MLGASPRLTILADPTGGMSMATTRFRRQRPLRKSPAFDRCVVLCVGCIARRRLRPTSTARRGRPQRAPPRRARRRSAPRAVFSGRLASPDELRDEPLDKPSGHIELYAVNFARRSTVDLYNEDGSFNDDALDQLNHLWRCKRTDTEKANRPAPVRDALAHLRSLR